MKPAKTFTEIVPGGRLDVELCVSSGQVFRWRKHENGAWVGSDGPTWYRIFQLDDETLGVETNGDQGDFHYYFRLDWNAIEVEEEIISKGPELEPYVHAMTGLRLLRPSSAVEAFYGFLCTPNNNLSRIMSMNLHLATYSPIVDHVDGVAIHSYPGTEAIADLSEELLREHAFGYRAATIPAVARQVRERGGDAYIMSLRRIPYERAHAELLSITGIGPKLADCICLFALHHTEAVPVDTHIWQAATRLYFPEWQNESLNAKRYRAIGDAFRDRFGKLAGWAHQYLFYDNVLNWRNRP